MDGMMGQRGRDRGDDAAAGVARIVESEVIPRLLKARLRHGGEPTPTEAHVQTLAQLALSRDGAAADAQVFALKAGGMSSATLLDRVIGPAARRLGDLWHSDALNFVDVALACGRLTAIVRRLGAETEVAVEAAAPQALVVTLEMERHGLGAMVFAHHLRAAGWAVCESPGADRETLRRLAGAARWNMVALSVGSDRYAGAVKAAITAVRAAARPARPFVVVGGAAVTRSPGFAERLGADHGGCDPAAAIAQAQGRLPRRFRDVTSEAYA